jgi:hypothetical protein
MERIIAAHDKRHPPKPKPKPAVQRAKEAESAV